ncbi:hypothetical protein C7T94_09520 [Pedobacter yulinensis]|uniref:TonB-dependent receptor n=1 Tax=Pedobacter yulinensis TaxID=2126353 RepID=A0A2T3HKA7_9SPHI|nr:TonB-dependent receptor [Pedobacter yulinensis]PST82864.1 hypothetical protein C7T94_09520 [Pedobacter yulinensis]
MIKHITQLKCARLARSTTGLVMLLLVFLTAPASLRAQNIPVTGTVTGMENEVLAGVNVAVKGSQQTVNTNETGAYTLNVPGNAVLVFTYVGYKRREVPVNNRGRINVQLEPTNATLDDVVVMGYGTVRKSDVTGAVSSVKLEDVNEKRVISVPESLQGKIAGVNILNNTGEPGSGMTFNIRGLTSVSGNNQPLIVIDGQPIESSVGSATAGMNNDWGTQVPPSDPLASLNPSDIASIEVLKDASSTAIYGSRGANGVVLITTRSGATGNDKISYTTRLDRSSLPKKLGVLSSLEFMQFKNEAAVNDGKLPVYTDFQLDSIANSVNTNWQDLVYRNALSQDHQLSLSGRDNKGNYLINGNFTQQNSVLNNADYARGGLRVNLDRNLTSKLQLSVRSYASLANRDYGSQSNSQGNLGSSAVMGAIAYNPLNTPYGDDGELDETVRNNPVVVTEQVKDRTSIRTFIANVSLNYRITPDLSFKASGGVNDLYSVRNVYYPRTTFIGNRDQGSAVRADNLNSNFLVDNILTYKKITGKHSINAVGGYSYQQWSRRATSQNSANFPSDALGYNNLGSAASPGVMNTLNKAWALQSLLARVNYSYASRYLLTLTGRYDGATRLAEGNKWNLFPSIGLGWNISNERFFKERVKSVSELKIRGSYGVAGNENIAVGATQATYGIGYGVIGQNIIPGYITADFENPNLKWERTEQYNIGVDLAMFKNRLNLSADYYYKRTTDLLINLPLPTSATYGNYYTNVGEVMNKGFDVEGSFDVLNGPFKLNIGANFSIMENKVIDMGQSNIVYGGVYINGGDILLNQALQVAKPGYPISSFWGYKTEGIYQTPEEVAAGPEATTAKPGDIRFVDFNGDGKISDEDKTVIGKPNPDYTFGFNADMSYRRFTFSFSLLGSEGNQIINLTRWLVGANNSNGNYNQLQETYYGRWTGPGTSNVYPKATSATARLSRRFPDWMVEDASFLRLQNVTLGYRFKLPKSMKVNGLRVYLSGTNLLTLTNYSGYDPNINAFGHFGLMSGIDYGTLPQSRTVSAGLELTF